MGGILAIAGAAVATAACGSDVEGQRADVEASAQFQVNSLSTAQTLFFRVKADELPASLGLPKAVRSEKSGFVVWIDRREPRLTIDSNQGGRRWTFSPARGTVAVHDAVEALDPAVTTAAMQLLDDLFESFGACSPEVGTVPEGIGNKPTPTSGQGWWTKVQCPWFPSAMLPLYLGYVQYAEEPPQVVRARFAYDGEAIDLSVHGRILYNEPAPESASLPTKQPWSIRKLPPTRPGATHREIIEHERRKRQLGIP